MSAIRKLISLPKESWDWLLEQATLQGISVNALVATIIYQEKCSRKK